MSLVEDGSSTTRLSDGGPRQQPSNLSEERRILIALTLWGTTSLGSG